MVDSGLEVLEINDDGTSSKLTISGTIKDQLSSNKVVLIINDRKKIIWIWKGVNARVRKKFIAARQAQEIKGNRGLTYKIDSIEHGDEPKEFIKLIGGKVPMEETTVPEDTSDIIEDSQIIKPKYTDIRSSTISGVNAPVSKEEHFHSAPPIIQQHTPPPTNQQPTIVQPIIKQDRTADVLNEIESMPVPEGYKRELIIIGNEAFSLVEIKKSFMGEEKIEYKLDKTDTPDGDFLGVGYTPRTIVRNGEIIAIELLKSFNNNESTQQDLSKITIKSLKIIMHKS
ncbi:MAG: hypothetical protein ACTSPY_16375 [Candidatus Helarchaeota archaeon]